MSSQGLVLIALHVGLAIAGSAPSGACLNGAPTRECQQDEAGVLEGSPAAILTQLKDLDKTAQLKNTEDISALFQSKNAEVLTTRVPPKGDPNMVADQIVAPVRPRMQKLMEINATLHSLKGLIGIGTTPELAGIIQSLIDIVKTDVQDRVKRDQADAQSEMDTRIDALTKTTESAVGEKLDADQRDTTHDQCVTEETQRLEVYETCKADEAALSAEKYSTAYCTHPDLFISYELPPVIGHVDFSKPIDSILQQLEDQRQFMEKHFADAKAKALGDQLKWIVAHQRCQEKLKQLEAKTKVCGENSDYWRLQHEKCVNARYSKKLSLCEFGHAYQSKCTAKAAVDKLKADIIGEGTIWSEPEREDVWTWSSQLACILTIFKASTELKQEDCDRCTLFSFETAAQFTEDVTRIDLKQATYDSLTSEAKFTCAETGFIFGSGALWTVPGNDGPGWIPTRASYTRSTGHKYAIEPDSDQTPLPFCAAMGTASTCGSTFDCGAGGRMPADTVCYLGGGCKSADCCVLATLMG